MSPGECRSGQSGQTVNLLVHTYGGSNPSSPTSPTPSPRDGVAGFCDQPSPRHAMAFGGSLPAKIAAAFSHTICVIISRYRVSALPM